ncbi:unnamed protein product [Rotaria magnacalcarata]|uniref:Reverse transcriptase domain-containing protein n=3 Tax=Rotaria magnacalcarata TaxID=392030 RepID=A0A815NY83_9BILA|nr:unnamed protein product [Rotaria magnacalcarata]
MGSVDSLKVFPSNNVDGFLRSHHGVEVLHAYRSFRKLSLRLESICLDIRFLKTCRANSVIPKFLWFNMSSPHLTWSRVYQDCQRRFLNVEIDWKYQYFYRTKIEYESWLNWLRELVSCRLFEHLYLMVVKYCRPLLKKKENVLQGKLWNLGVRYECYEVNDSKVVQNLSTRIVSDEEIQCLANGLGYGLIPKRVDKLMIASNIEQFYHRVTDITQHHKKFMNELKEAGAGAIVKSDVRVLNPKELTLAADLRSLTQSFLHKANEFQQQNNKLDSKEKNYRTILKKLREDDSIIITRPDKVRTLSKDFSKHRMVSFDVSSLYTNVPINETIEIILNSLYVIQPIPPIMKRDDMKELLIFATKNSHFLFDGKVYDQIDGVSMGSPLAPLLAEIFLQEFERKNSSLLQELGIVYWKRYVDDTFVLLNSQFTTKHVCAELSKCHPSIQFTSEEEDPATRTLPFLDVLVRRKPGADFHTCVYRKPTFSGLMTKWSSFVPKRYKYSAISTIIYRAIQICSSKNSLHKEFDFIRGLCAKNGYPARFVNSIIKRQLNLQKSTAPPTPIETTTDTVVLRVPYFGAESQIYGKRVTAAAAKHYPFKKIRVVYDVTDRIGRGFKLKDSIADEFKSGVVYEATCTTCNQAYVGQTFHHLKTRIHEYILDLKKFLPQTTTVKPSRKSKQRKKKNQQETKTTIKYTGPITRSKTGKLPPVVVKLNSVDLDNLLDLTKLKEKKENIRVPKSSITKHYIATNHIITEDNFKILHNEQLKYRLKIKESLLIITRAPQLNGTERSMPLYIYPNGIKNNEQM